MREAQQAQAILIPGFQVGGISDRICAFHTDHKTKRRLFAFFVCIPGFPCSPMAVESGAVGDDTNMTCLFQCPVVRKLSFCHAIGLSDGPIVDVWGCLSCRATEQGRHTQGDPPPAHLGQRHGILLPFSGPDGIDRIQQIAVALYRIPGEVKMGIDNQHGAPWEIGELFI